MRDVVIGFYSGVLRKLLDDGAIALSDSVLIVCAGPQDEQVVRDLGFQDCTLTNLDPRAASSHQDAENLSYDDGSFDIVMVHAGLHHCFSPHRALLEMYRVARKRVVAFESRDSLLLRCAVKLGATVDYEVDSVANGRGGVAETGIPNFVYRWTEREIIKTISSYDPTRAPSARFFYDLRLPIQRLARSGNAVLVAVSRLIEPTSRILAALFPKQCNEFAFTITKAGALHPWIK
ncbi:methyltransferase domain-containing protein [Bradyrhizobium sp. 2]|uniref:methyltransferase domain-containing protein n=1 Tax=Bradyrhizobium sp. 2 TaxID=190045 RepID=UPI001FFC1073|nr:methyltransferase domain-containing protein [Bradyrhizobium sp. 2]MCK1460933.1 methyltransferase domain-containing protein [Bradyrhizobium sp. 2]